MADRLVKMRHIGDPAKAWDPELVHDGKQTKGDDKDRILSFLHDGAVHKIHPGDVRRLTAYMARHIKRKLTQRTESMREDPVTGRKRVVETYIDPPLEITEFEDDTRHEPTELGVLERDGTTGKVIAPGVRTQEVDLVPQTEIRKGGRPRKTEDNLTGPTGGNPDLAGTSLRKE